MKPTLRLALCLFVQLLGLRAGPPAPAPGRLWSHDNLFAWCVVPFDARKRGPEDRAAMLERLGFPAFAYDWRDKDIPTFDAELTALQRHHIRLLAWWFPLAASDPKAKATLETFRRHGVHPQLWVALWNAADAAESAVRIQALAELARPYGCAIELYNHNGWFGLEANELAILDRLRMVGVTDVGLVYNFSHARDDRHDDTTDFPAVWSQIKDHVVAVNVTGMKWEGHHVYPSQGDRELGMLRTIEQSGWRGPVGLIAEMGGDAEVTLANYRTGLDWLAAELQAPGAGGPRPFPEAPAGR